MPTTVSVHVLCYIFSADVFHRLQSRYASEGEQHIGKPNRRIISH